MRFLTYHHRIYIITIMKFLQLLLILFSITVVTFIPVGCNQNPVLIPDPDSTNQPEQTPETTSETETAPDTDISEVVVYNFGEWLLEPQTYHNGEYYFFDDIDLKRTTVMHDWAFWCASYEYLDDEDYWSYENVGNRIEVAHENGCKVEVIVSILDIFYTGTRPGGEEHEGFVMREIGADDDVYEASAIDLDGNHMQYEFPPAFIGCTNQPGWQQYLESRLMDAIDLGYDGIIIDDFEGSSRWLTNTYVGYAGQHGSGGGCFCDCCEAGFRDYLKTKYTSGELSSLGIEDIDTFDYSDFLISRGWTQEKLGAEAAKFYYWEYDMPESSVPLYRDYYDFQIQEVVSFTQRLKDSINAYALEKYGKEISWGVNMGEQPYFTHYFYNVYDRNVGSIHGFHYPPSGSEAYWYRLDYNIYGNPRVRDTIYDPLWVSVINEYETENLLLLKRAEAYANQGSWLTHDWIAIEGPTEEEMAAAFRSDATLVNQYNSFFLDNADFFDFQNMRTGAEVAVIYSTASIHYSILPHQFSFQGICEILNALHVQYDPLAAGDGLAYPDYISDEKLDDYDIIFLPNTTALTAAQVEKFLNYVERGGTIVALGNVGKLDEYGKELRHPQFEELLAQPQSGYGEGNFYTLREEGFNADDIIDEENEIHDIATAYYLFYVEYNEDVNPFLYRFDEQPGEYISEMTAISIQQEIGEIIDASLEDRMMLDTFSNKVGAQVYFNTETPELVVHLLNYNYNLAEDQIYDQLNVPVSIRIPDGFDAHSVAILSPDFEGAEELEFELDKSYINFNVPKLHIWDVVAIDLN